jgi:hypothetical protein
VRQPGPPRFVVRTTVATLTMVAVVLTAVFATMAYNVRQRVRSVVSEKLEAGQRMLSALEQRRARELNIQVATFAENPTLKAYIAVPPRSFTTGPPVVARRHSPQILR